jgi:hypothetical protein
MAMAVADGAGARDPTLKAAPRVARQRRWLIFFCSATLWFAGITNPGTTLKETMGSS